MDVDEQYDKSQLPDTQKYDSDYNSGDIGEVVEENNSHQIWGRLYPIGFNLQPRDLIKPAYRIGRGPECEIQLTSQHVEPIILAVISKVQFRLELEADNTGSHVFSLVDLSSNGTFVNKKKVGKNGKVYLSNNDEISLSQPHNRAYLFIDALICNSWLPLSERHNYSIITQLGQGAFGEVKLAIEKRTGKRYAIKRILKTIYQSDVVKVQIANEIRILKQLNHQCTIKMEDVFENEEAVFIVLEYMPGGDLQQRIRQRKVLDESDAKFLFYQLMLAVQYLHQEGITHRDLKPENILLASDTCEPLLKLSDFGLSKLMQSASTLKTFCGTLSYTAPEILLSKGCSSYTPQVDVWSLGCILYLCLSGFPAFSSKGSMPIQEQIVRGYYQSLKSFPELTISDSANDLIDRMLVVNPLHRITVADTLKHSWLQDGQTKSKVENLIANAGKENLENLSPEFENLKKKRITEFAVTKRLD